MSFADVSHDGQPDFLRLEPYSRDAHGPTLVTFLGDGTGGFVEEQVPGLPRHFGEYGDDHVRFGLIENEHRTRQAVRGIREMFRQDGIL